MIRIFISYSSKDKELAGTLKGLLEFFNLEVFLAHEDIRPTAEWQDTIIDELKESDVFIPFLTYNFSRSHWTDQETGMAIALGKLIIPLRIGVDPYGFIGKFQALKVNRNFIEDSIVDLLKVIGEKKEFKDSLKNCLISALIKARTFHKAEEIISILSTYNTFSQKQIYQIFIFAIQNNQVRMCAGGSIFLESLMSKYNSMISPNLKKEFEAVKDKF